MTPRWTASQLRRDLNFRAEVYARSHNLLHDLSAGSSPTVLFGRDEQGRHGNFHPAAYERICANPDWLRRLAKVHTASRRSVARHDWHWMELDAATSSDALLMNIFCHPLVFDGTHLAVPVAALLGVDRATIPCFGAHPGVPLRTTLKPRSKNAAPCEALDRTEIDLTLADSTAPLFVEAKLTESDFQTAPPALIARYRDLETVFDVERLPRKLLSPPPLPPNLDPDDPTVNLRARATRIRIAGYQLIRNVLAAYTANASFCVLSDARRYDLIETWFAVLSAVHAPVFTPRLKLLTWQELAATLPHDLQSYLDVRYAIVPT
ncbi:MAG TPA: hypothetical protein VGN01_09065 [Acidobacteriaceae bacterium]|jgi:hypothetical protein